MVSARRTRSASSSACTLYDVAREAGVSTATVSRVLRGTQKIWSKGRRVRIEEQRDAAKPRCHVLEQTQPFAGQRMFESHEAGDIGFRPRQIRDDPGDDRVGDIHEHDRNCPRRIP